MAAADDIQLTVTLAPTIRPSSAPPTVDGARFGRPSEDARRRGRPDDTWEIFERVALADELIELFTLATYGYLD